MIKLIAALLATLTMLTVNATELEFVPYNKNSPEAKARTNAVKNISKSLTSAEKEKLTKLKSKYTQMLIEEKSKDTPIKSRLEIKRIKSEYFNEMIENLRPETVANIMKNKRVISKTDNKKLVDSADKVNELFLKVKKIKKNDN